MKRFIALSLAAIMAVSVCARRCGRSDGRLSAERRITARGNQGYSYGGRTGRIGRLSDFGI